MGGDRKNKTWVIAIAKLIIFSIMYKAILHVAFGWQLWSLPGKKKLISVTKKLSICPTRLHLFAIMFIFLLFFILIFAGKEFTLIKLSSKYFNPHILPVLFRSNQDKSRYFETAVTAPAYIEKRLTRKLQVQFTEGYVKVNLHFYFTINALFSYYSCGLICWLFLCQGQLWCGM